MSGKRDNVHRISRRRCEIVQSASLAELERSGRTPINVARLMPKRAEELPAASGDPTFIAWQAIIAVLSPAQREDANRLIRILSGRRLNGFDPGAADMIAALLRRGKLNGCEPAA